MYELTGEVLGPCQTQTKAFAQNFMQDDTFVLVFEPRGDQYDDVVFLASLGS